MIKSSRINIINDSIDIITISNEAKAAKRNNKEVIDVTIGSLYDNDDNFLECKTLTEVIGKLSPNEKYTYSSISGGEEFGQRMREWIFGSSLTEIEKEHYLFTFATLGGSTGLSNIFYNYLAPNETMLLPNSYWNVYSKIVNTIDSKYIEYEMFQQDNLGNYSYNINGLMQAANKIISSEHKLVTIINTPNHNPTGYALTDQELTDIIEYFNSVKVPVVFILDIAYIDFSDYEKTRKQLAILKKAESNVLISVIFSGSKTFSAYGLRFGSITLITKDKDTLDEGIKTLELLGRTRTSSPNKMMISAFNSIMKNPLYKKSFICELINAQNIINERSNKLLNALDELKIDYYPYKGGFFILIKSKNPFEDFECLKKLGVYTIPTNNGIRIAICSLKYNDIERLTKALVVCIK